MQQAPAKSLGDVLVRSSAVLQTNFGPVATEAKPLKDEFPSDYTIEHAVTDHVFTSVLPCRLVS
eukprot:3864556-Amphidinium_carterae.1